MGATPKMNRSAKDGARSSPHYGGEGVTHSPIVPRCLLTARYGRFMRDPRRPAWVPAQSRVSDPISESEVGSEAHAGVGETRHGLAACRRASPRPYPGWCDSRSPSPPAILLRESYRDEPAANSWPPDRISPQQADTASDVRRCRWSSSLGRIGPTVSPYE